MHVTEEETAKPVTFCWREWVREIDRLICDCEVNKKSEGTLIEAAVELIASMDFSRR